MCSGPFPCIFPEIWNKYELGVVSIYIIFRVAAVSLVISFDLIDFVVLIFLEFFIFSTLYPVYRSIWYELTSVLELTLTYGRLNEIR